MSFRGASEASEPGIHNHRREYGFRACAKEAHPGMTSECCSTQITESHVQPASQKYSGSLLTQITSSSSPSRPNTTGAFRDRHERRAGDAVDAVAPRTNGAFRGRRSRVVLTPRRRRQVGERDFTCDGDKKARSPGRARNKLLKPSRAGMPGDPGATVVTNARAYYSTRAAAGATGTRHSPRPLWADRSCTTRAPYVARMRSRILPSLRAKRSNPFFLRGYMDCFASLAMTVYSSERS
jgi:hypothetical protein